MPKKALLIIAAVSAFLIMLPFLISGVNTLLVHGGVLVSDDNVINGFYDTGIHYDKDGWRDYTDCCEVHYNKKYNQQFADNPAYTRAGAENAVRLPPCLRWFSA